MSHKEWKQINAVEVEIKRKKTPCIRRNANENFHCDDDNELPTTMKREDASEMNAETLADFFIFFLQLPLFRTIYTFYSIIIIGYRFAPSSFILFLLQPINTLNNRNQKNKLTSL